MWSVSLGGMPTSKTTISSPYAKSPKPIAGPNLVNPTDRQTSAGNPLGSNSPVFGLAPLGRSIATIFFPLDFATPSSDEIGSSIGLEMLNPKTPSSIKSVLSHKFDRLGSVDASNTSTTAPPVSTN